MPIIRKFYPSGYQHIYQISIDRSVIFCSYADYMLLFTLIGVYCRVYGAHIISCVIMINHFHLEASFGSLQKMEEFMQIVTHSFAVRYNRQYGLHGKLFHKPYGSAPKVKEEKIKSTMIYIANNPVVKLATKKASDYRWNFLKYCESSNPFSKPYDPDEASRNLVSLVKLARKRRRNGKCISYDFFRTDRFESLSNEEKLQLIDIIISIYNFIDYGPIISKFGSMAKFFEATNTVAGSDYDLNDDYEKEDYRHYYKMIRILRKEGFDLRNFRFRGLEGLPPATAHYLADLLRLEADASDLEIAKLLRIPFTSPTKRR